MIRNRINRWSNVKGCIGREVVVCDGVVLELDAETRLPDGLKPLVGEDSELVIHFTSEGYYDPGVFGRPESSHEPEGEDIRTVTSIELDGKPVPRELWDAIEEVYRDEIDEAELESEPERD